MEARSFLRLSQIQKTTEPFELPFLRPEDLELIFTSREEPHAMSRSSQVPNSPEDIYHGISTLTDDLLTLTDGVDESLLVDAANSATTSTGLVSKPNIAPARPRIAEKRPRGKVLSVGKRPRTRSSDISDTSEEEYTDVGERVDSPPRASSSVHGSPSTNKKSTKRHKRSPRRISSEESVQTQSQNKARVVESTPRYGSPHSRQESPRKDMHRKKSDRERGHSRQRSVSRNEEATSSPVVDHPNKDLMKHLLTAKKVTNSTPGVYAASTTSRISKTSTRRPQKSSSQLGITIDADIERLRMNMKDSIRSAEISKATIRMLINTTRSQKSGSKDQKVIAQMELIKTFPPASSLPEDDRYPKIAEEQCFFAADRMDFGFDSYMIQTGTEFDEQMSLHYALQPHIKKHDNSLDIVFRRGLKCLFESPDFVYDGENTFDAPMFISGALIELSLIKNIRDHYRRNMDVDIILFFTGGAGSRHSELLRLVTGCRCEHYVRRLIQRYTGTVSGFDALFEGTLDISRMRVWTTRKTQTETNSMFLNYLNIVSYTCEARSMNTGVEGRGTRMVQMLGEELASKMKGFVQNHKQFLSEMLKASELMTYACLGLTIDDPRVGFSALVGSYFIMEKYPEKTYDELNPLVCMNYILASKYKRDHPQPKRIIFHPADYWARYDESEEDETQRRST